MVGAAATPRPAVEMAHPLHHNDAPDGPGTHLLLLRRRRRQLLRLLDVVLHHLRPRLGGDDPSAVATHPTVCAMAVSRAVAVAVAVAVVVAMAGAGEGSMVEAGNHHPMKPRT